MCMGFMRDPSWGEAARLDVVYAFVYVRLYVVSQGRNWRKRKGTKGGVVAGLPSGSAGF